MPAASMPPPGVGRDFSNWIKDRISRLGYVREDDFVTFPSAIHLLESCRRMGIPEFVFASSSGVDGPETPLPACEDHSANPCTVPMP